MTVPVDILECDDHWIIVNKPEGLLSVPGRGPDLQDCLSARVQQIYPDARIVHRLDMATSGLLVMARGATAQRTLNAAFANRVVLKRYVAVVAGQVIGPTGLWKTIDLPIAVDWPNRPLRIIDPVLGKPSVTRFRLAPENPALTPVTPGGMTRTRLELEPHTGRSHQLRVHLKALGHPICGDQLYAPEAIKAMSPRLLLHASELTLPHPQTGESKCFRSCPDF